MASPIAEAKELIPSVSGAGIMNFMLWFIIFLAVLAVCGFAVYMVLRNIKFKYKIVIWKKIGGQMKVIGKDRAMEMRVGTGGDRALYLQKHKKVLPIPGEQADKNSFYFFVRSDGEWIPFMPDDFDEQARVMGAKLLANEMRFARVGLQGTMKDRYDKPKFLEKYGALILYSTTFAVVGVILFLISREIVNMISQMGPVLDKATEVIEELRRLTGAIDVLKAGGSGMVAA